uniref:LOB domain-containing protein 37-like n=1 Tax=Erigeron canadensis TaxID=72917 RepID=UPI001CB8A9AB|nr:LOB domain-containing protein 37-like [Erigeron canadensis]
MSCNGCRVLRKGCNENCILRHSLSTIETAQAQASATLFVAKFFGRAGLMSFLSSVPEQQRPDLFQSLLFEACGRTVNPINGAVGLLWTGNWHLCQSAVATVLRGGTIHAMPEAFSLDQATKVSSSESNNVSEDNNYTYMELGVAKSSGLNSYVDGSNDRLTIKLERTASLNVSETTTLESSTPSPCSETKLLRLFS